MKINFREALRSFVPPWLSDRPQLGLSRGFSFLYAMVAPQDTVLEHTVQAMSARLPGVGTTTALPLIGNDREVLRGPIETEVDYIARLKNWLYYAKRRGSRESIAFMLHKFLPGSPKVKVISRSGAWTTVDASGTVNEYLPGTWDWDSLSHPERAASSWDLWIIVYQSYYGAAPNYGTNQYGGPNCFGLATPKQVFSDILRTVSVAKSAHSIARSIILTSNAADFSPGTPGSLMPDGWWGNYSKKDGSGNQIPARPASLRFYDEVY
jgi:hypothetical protein